MPGAGAVHHIKTGKAHGEHITSAIPLRADIAAAYLHFACEPEHDIKPTLLIADASDAVLRLAYLDRSKTSVETVGWP
jgi:hypothetical protein